MLLSTILNNSSKLLCQNGDWKSWQDILSTGGEVKILGVNLAASDIKGFIRTAILVAVSALVVLLVGVVGYGGFTWITAGDNEEKLQKAKKIMKDGLIAIAIAFGFLALLGVMAGVLGVDITDFSFLDTLVGE
jgi:uncharacterized membrane protein